jgi:hypothetical protein
MFRVHQQRLIKLFVKEFNDLPSDVYDCKYGSPNNEINLNVQNTVFLLESSKRQISQHR